MPFATTLAGAAGQSSDDLTVRNIAGQLKTQLGIFWGNSLPLFPESDPNSHPVSNWLVVLAAVQDQLSAGTVSLQQLQPAQQAIYRLLWMADFAQSAGLITASQGNTLLATYNANIAFP